METNFTQDSAKTEKPCVLVCQHKSCLAVGSAEVLTAFEEAEVSEFSVIGTSCQGQCSSGPTVRIVPEETWYCRVKPQDVPVIVEEHLQGGKLVSAKLHPRIHMSFGY
ncbi:MAG: (2Fe-2S) ferredoxin domain-containing protein [Moorea sp. SIO3C2]|nr:(2Fe-2S) ferredoxin domain-containing protein [Moorena sp. SIO3C2]